MKLSSAPPILKHGAPPPHTHFEKVLSMAAERGEIPNTLTFLIPRGGQSGTLTFFLKSVTCWPTLSKFRGGPVQKITLYADINQQGNIFGNM